MSDDARIQGHHVLQADLRGQTECRPARPPALCAVEGKKAAERESERESERPASYMAKGKDCYSGRETEAQTTPRPTAATAVAARS